MLADSKITGEYFKTITILNGKEYKFDNIVTDMPDNFKVWVKDNESKLAHMAKHGKSPYFISRNKKIVNDILNPKELSVLDKAKLRHEARTSEQIEDIKRRWKESRAKLQSQITSIDSELEKLLGIKQGAPMSFEEANEMRGNPHYIRGSYSGYTINCQSCVVANELRRRGFDVEAMMNTRHRNNLPYILSKGTEKAWIDPIIFKTGTPNYKVAKDGSFRTYYEKINWKEFNEFTKEVGRYHVSFDWKGTDSGHIIVFERLSDGHVKWYDPQSGKTKFFNTFYTKQIKGNLCAYRVDNLKLNPEFSGVVAKAGTTKPNSIQYAKKQGGWVGTDGADVQMPIFTKENTSFEYKNGGKVTTHKSRIEHASKS
ncbi:MAG: hypothetical protein IKY58_05935, partial [Paludibacteraceae bacterium]|nr:hypothetical protein [Paludibacteraceae bacterium]